MQSPQVVESRVSAMHSPESVGRLRVREDLPVADLESRSGHTASQQVWRGFSAVRRYNHVSNSLCGTSPPAQPHAYRICTASVVFCMHRRRLSVYIERGSECMLAVRQSCMSAILRLVSGHQRRMSHPSVTSPFLQAACPRWITFFIVQAPCAHVVACRHYLLCSGFSSVTASSRNALLSLPATISLQDPT